jgi:hypothetical protein
VKWYGAGFKGFQEIEGIMDRAIDAANQAAQQPKEPDPMHQAEVQEKMAGTIERKAAAIQKLADAQLKTSQSMAPFPAPPEQFINGMPQPMGAPPVPPGGTVAQMGGMPPGMGAPSAPGGGASLPSPPLPQPQGMGNPNMPQAMGTQNMPPAMPQMPPVIPGVQR